MLFVRRMTVICAHYVVLFSLKEMGLNFIIHGTTILPSIDIDKEQIDFLFHFFNSFMSAAASSGVKLLSTCDTNLR